MAFHVHCAMARQLPAQDALIGAWFASDARSSPVDYVPNRKAMSAAPAASVIFPKDKAFLPGLSSVTVGGRPDPYGGSTANRYNITGNSPYTGSTRYIKAGTYKLTVQMKSSLASPPPISFNFGTNPATRQEVQPTTSWATYTVTLTQATSGSVYVQLFYARLFNGTVDIDFTELDIAPVSYAGAHADAETAGHLYLGFPGMPAAGVDGSGMIASGGALLGNNSFGIAQISTADMTLSEGTILAVAKMNSHGTAINYCGIFGDYTTYTNRTLGEYPVQGRSVYVGGYTSSPFAVTKDLGLNFVAHGCRWSGSQCDRLIGCSPVDIWPGISPITAFKAAFVNTVNQAYNGGWDVASICFWNKSLSHAELADAVELMTGEAHDSGLILSPDTRYLIHEGDSISVTNGGYMPAGATAGAYLYNGFTTGRLCAYPGSTLYGGTYNVMDRVADENAATPPRAAGGNTVWTCAIGRNDLLTADLDAWLATYAGLCASQKQHFKKVGVGTILPSIASGFNAKRNYVNAVIATWPGLGVCDFTVDFAADPLMGIDGDGVSTGPWNTTYYSDGTHPTVAGTARLAPIYAAAINANT
jgi:hypothetical protein